MKIHTLLISFFQMIMVSCGLGCSGYWDEANNGSRHDHHNCSHDQGPLPWLSEEQSLQHSRNLKEKNIRQKFFPEFIHIAKNGGGTISSVRFAAQNTKIGEPFSAGMTRFQRNGTKGCHDGETPPRGMKSWHHEPTFCVVRHPLTHVVSSMNFAAQGVRGRDKAWVRRSLHHMAILLHEEQIRENNEGFLPETFDRSKFNNSQIPLSEKHLFIGEQWCHFLPQSDYIWNEQGERTCNYVLRYEHFHEDFEFLSELYGQSVEESMNTTAGTKSSILESKDFKKHVYQYENKFTYFDMDEDLREAYLNLYALDLCLLGYDRDPAKPVASLLRASVQQYGETEFRKCFHERDPRVKLGPLQGI